MLLTHTYRQFTSALFAVLLSLCFAGEAGATHIVGGEIFYTYLGNNQYEITLKVFRDCGPTNTNGTGFDDPASVAVYNNTGNTLYQSLEMYLSSASVNYIPVALANPCFVLPPDVCVEQAIYKRNVNLPPNAAGYTITYQRCCRNPSIVNLYVPEDQGATFTTTVPGTNLLPNGVNSCARFNHLPPVALCQYGEFFFDHSASDPDGDSLAYHLCTPMLGGTPASPAPTPPSAPPYTPVSWAAGFNTQSPITSNPEFTIDPVTGQMSGTPTQLGQFVIGVCVSEYRNGVLINTTNRDFQFNVTICDPNIIAAVPPTVEFCVGETVHFENNSINGTYFFWDFGVQGVDSDTSNMETPSYTYTESGSYTVMLTVNAGWPCADTAYTTVSSLSVISPHILMNGYSCLNGGDYYNFSSTAFASANASYNWNFGEGSVPQFSTLQNPGNVMMNPEAAQMNVILLVEDDGGCPETDEMTIDLTPAVTASIVPQDSFCDGYFYQFESVATPAQSYHWDFGIPGDADVSGQPNPGFLFPDTGHYEITLIVSAPFTCPDTTSMDFAIYGLLNPYFPPHDPMCFDVNKFNFQASGATSSNAVYTWDFGSAANQPTSHAQNPQNIIFTEPGHHNVSLTIEENGCVRTYQEDVWVPQNMIADFLIGNAEGCPELNVNLVAAVHAGSAVTYSWDLGDGATANTASVQHTYTNSGHYDVEVTVATTAGCYETLSKLFKNAIFVYPEPVASFNIEPQRVNILEPLVAVRDSSMGATDCYYTLSDGSLYEDFNFDHEWNEAGMQWITQHVMNEYGCTDERTGRVIVEGFNFYAPNSFTPDGDGLNDVWIPIMQGVSEYHLRIIDRWGELVFETYDPEEPWLGNFQGGDYFVPNGVYQYVVLFRDKLFQPYEFQGHIVLVR